MSNFTYPNYITPSIDDPNVLELAKTINSEKLQSIPFNKNLLPTGNCYWNVEHFVNTHGGSIQYGWIFNLWPNILVEAMHHAVWKTPEGNLIDITENYSMLSKTHVIFLPDDTSELSTLDIVPAIQNHYNPIMKNIVVQNFIAANKNKIDLIKHHIQALYNAGYRCELHRSKASQDHSSSPNMNYNQLSEIDSRAIKEIPQMIKTIEAHIGAYISHLNQLGQQEGS
ncbi:hypothetical protein [Acinetobacter pittii]|uniref:hypothetical protein n=1 Tax=Acinetobacter pittii TaxID=48296 RepID=UPI0021CD3AED|nr:hypothetical protein [Acinetobacter pittii]MCU4331920.1 hypothetical protein [Acinetobacter pittii]